MAGSVASQLEVAGSADFVRHFSSTKVDGEQLVAGALLIPPSHKGQMSINILGVMDGDLEKDLAAIRDRSRLVLRKTGRFFRWNIAEFTGAVAEEEKLGAVSIVADPLLAEDNWPDDPSHALIVGVPSDTLASDLMLDIVRPVVRGIYPAKTSAA